MEKANKAELQLALNQFILKCWEDYRGLRRQFYNEWRKYADDDSENAKREQEPKLKKLKKDIDSAKECPLDKNDIVHDKPPSKTIVDTWNKKRKNLAKRIKHLVHTKSHPQMIYNFPRQKVQNSHVNKVKSPNQTVASIRVSITNR